MGLLRKPEELNSNSDLHLNLDKSTANTQTLVESAGKTFNNRTALSYSLSDSVRQSLLQYAQGYVVIVDYYSKLESYIDKQTSSITVPLDYEDTVGKAYNHIKNFELKLSSSLTIDSNIDLTEFSVTGEAIIYPGTDPSIGDLFIMEVGASEPGVFIITQVQKLTLYADSFYRVNFSMHSFLTQELANHLQVTTIDTYVFDKSTYFDSNYSLLLQDDYLTIRILQDRFRDIVDAIYSTYLDMKYNSFSLKGQVYDPLAIDFFNSIVDYQDFPNMVKRAKVYFYSYITFMNKPKTIWHLLLNRYGITRVSATKEVVRIVRNYFFDTSLTALINSPIKMVITDYSDLSDTTSRYYPYLKYFTPSNEVITSNDDLSLYVVSEECYKAFNNEPYDPSLLTEIETVILKFLFNNLSSNSITDADKTAILSLLDSPIYAIVDTNLDATFYNNLLLLWIIKRYMYYLTNNRRVNAI